VTTAAFVGSRAGLLFERNLMVYRRSWMVIFSGVFEPLFYLFSMGIGLGHFVGKVPLPVDVSSTTRASSRQPCWPLLR